MNETIEIEQPQHIYFSWIFSREMRIRHILQFINEKSHVTTEVCQLLPQVQFNFVYYSTSNHCIFGVVITTFYFVEPRILLYTITHTTL